MAIQMGAQNPILQRRGTIGFAFSQDDRNEQRGPVETSQTENLLTTELGSAVSAMDENAEDLDQ